MPTPTRSPLSDVLTLATLELEQWAPLQRALHLSGVPLNDGDDDAATAAAAAVAAAAKADQDAAAAAAAAATTEDKDLGAGGKAALDAERKARRDAEKRAKDAEAKVKAAEDATATDLEKAERRATEAEGKVTRATEKLREAKLLVALGAEGLGGAQALAAARLLDDVEYDDADDAPTNLTERLAAAKAQYGEHIFKGAKPKAPKINGGEGNEDREGPNLSADEAAAAKAAGMTAEEYVTYQSPQPKLAAT